VTAPGPLGEEARRLVEAAREWAVRAFPEPAEEPAAHGAAECGWCPVCRTVAALRGDRPEVTDRLVELVTAAAGALAAVLDTLARPAAGPPPPAAAADPEPPPRRPQPIPLDGD
jgi:hypothetical protein